MNFLVSVIVPFFNAEKTLERLVDSILAQNTDVPYDIVLIDDGSADASTLIAEDYARKHPYIKYIRQENKGVSSARNTGIGHSSGEFICFVDADDQLNENYIQCLYETIKDKCDLAVCSYELLTIKYRKERKLEARSFEDIAEFLLYLEKQKRTFVQSVWNKIFKTEIIEKQNIKFNEKLSISEDHLFFLEYCKYIKTAKTIEDILYVHIQTGKSLTTRRYDMDILFNRAKKVYCQSNYISSLYPNKQYEEYAFSNYRIDYYYALLQMYHPRSFLNRKKRMEKIEDYCSLFSKHEVRVWNRRQKVPKAIDYFTRTGGVVILDVLFFINCHYYRFVRKKFNN